VFSDNIQFAQYIFRPLGAVPNTSKIPDNSISSLPSSTDIIENARFIRTNLLTLKEGEKGKIAICAAVYQEGRFITEWLLYVSLILRI
jgi:hypothetical protein